MQADGIGVGEVDHLAVAQAVDDPRAWVAADRHGEVVHFVESDTARLGVRIIKVGPTGMAGVGSVGLPVATEQAGPALFCRLLVTEAKPEMPVTKFWVSAYSVTATGPAPGAPPTSGRRSVIEPGPMFSAPLYGVWSVIVKSNSASIVKTLPVRP